MSALRHGWPIAFAALLVSFSAGCRSNGHCEMLELEQQMLENQLYELENTLEDREAQLAAAEQRIDALESGAPADKAEARPSAPRKPLFPRRARPGRTDGMPSSDALEELQIEPGVENSPGPSSQLTPPAGVPARLSSTAGPGRAGKPGAPVESIAIVTQKTGALPQRDGRASGVALVLEARDAAGRPVQTAGAVTIAAIDPSVEGAAGRVARWDFTAEAVGAQFVKRATGPAVEFELPWPGPPPMNSALALHVRFQTAQGRKLYAEVPLSLGAPVDRQVRAQPAQGDPPSAAKAEASTASRPEPPAGSGKRAVWKPYR